MYLSFAFTFQRSFRVKAFPFSLRDRLPLADDAFNDPDIPL